MKVGLLLVILFMFSSSARAEDATPQAAKTEMEAFDAQTGSVVVRGFSKMGELKGVYGGKLNVSAMELFEAKTGRKVYGITIDVLSSNDRSDRSFVDYDEIESLLSGIDYVAKLNKSVSQLENFQADYKTKDDLSISTFSEGDQIMAQVASGNIGRAALFVRANELVRLRQYVTDAKTKLDSIKSP